MSTTDTGSTTNNSTKQLFDEYGKKRDSETRNKIVESYLYLVDILIRKYTNKGIETDDLFQVGSMALVMAVERFDPSKGFEFSSFATPTIIGEIKRYFRDKGWAMKVPRKLKEISLLLPAAREALQIRLQRVPTIPELSEEIGYSEEDILEALEIGQNYNVYTLSQMTEEQSDAGEHSGIEKFTGIQEQGYENFETEDFIKSLMNGMSDREREIFQERLLNGRTQQEVAEALGVSQMTVSRMENEIKSKFRTEFFK
ncbi:MAG: sigma-70 family RNA polymerase sigma factor [Clostridiales Family XIII bacterium]|jgi:RNA polymerase sigma-B factor|nr:sigma-70 family RNA polymerase sigma factor [Clostridiales Family XIII bacterium]